MARGTATHLWAGAADVYAEIGEAPPAREALIGLEQSLKRGCFPSIDGQIGSPDYRMSALAIDLGAAEQAGHDRVALLPVTADHVDIKGRCGASWFTVAHSGVWQGTEIRCLHVADGRTSMRSGTPSWPCFSAMASQHVRRKFVRSCLQDR